MLIVGYGSVGRAIAARLTPFEVTLTAVASRPRDGDDLVPTVHGVEELPELLPRHDVVIVIVPLLPATTGLVDREFLAAMPDGALLVNVARGAVVDTGALVHDDVVRPAAGGPRCHRPGAPACRPPAVGQPGGPHHPARRRRQQRLPPRAVRLLREQLAAYALGQPLRNIVHEG